MKVDAIVNTANPKLVCGSGTDGEYSWSQKSLFQSSGNQNSGIPKSTINLLIYPSLSLYQTVKPLLHKRCKAGLMVWQSKALYKGASVHFWPEHPQRSRHELCKNAVHPGWYMHHRGGSWRTGCIQVGQAEKRCWVDFARLLQAGVSISSEHRTQATQQVQKISICAYVRSQVCLPLYKIE